MGKSGQMWVPVVAIAIVAAWASCSGSGGGDNSAQNGGPNGTPNNVSPNNVAPNNGEVGNIEGVVVAVPDGAIDPPVEVTVRQVDRNEYPREGIVSWVYDIGPSGTQFDIPVTVVIPIGASTPEGSTIKVVRFDEASGEWEPLEGNTIVGSAVIAKTDHFSIFAAMAFPDAAACDNVWEGGPGAVVPLLVPGNISVAGATRTEEKLQGTGEEIMALGSTWETTSCSVVVSGDFGPGFTGPGEWYDYSKGGQGDIAHSGGAFSFTLQSPRGPYMAISDPCNAELDAPLYELNIHIAADCVDLCAGVTCNTDDGNACTTDTCDPLTGMCEQAPSTGTCGSSSAGLCVQGRCMMEVPMNVGASGNSLCAAEGLTCDESPVLDPAAGACLAFNPTASVSMDANGWAQAVYCTNNTGRACQGRVNDCHHCPACLADSLDCSLTNSDLFENAYVSCAP